ncbi:MAG: hypothetical protein QM808_04810 [Steroidobacteraceae bacterium]
MDVLLALLLEENTELLALLDEFSELIEELAIELTEELDEPGMPMELAELLAALLLDEPPLLTEELARLELLIELMLDWVTLEELPELGLAEPDEPPPPQAAVRQPSVRSRGIRARPDRMQYSSLG